MIIFEVTFNHFWSEHFRGSWGSIEIWLKPETLQPKGSLTKLSLSKSVKCFVEKKRILQTHYYFTVQWLPVDEVEDDEDWVDEQEGETLLFSKLVTFNDFLSGSGVTLRDDVTSSVGTGVIISSIKLSLWLNCDVLRLPFELLQSRQIKKMNLFNPSSLILVFHVNSA